MASKLEVKLKKGSKQHRTNAISQSNFFYMYVTANTINFYYILSLTIKITPTVLRILAGKK